MSLQYKQFIEYFSVYGFDLSVAATFKLSHDKYTLTELSMVCPVFEIFMLDFDDTFMTDFMSGAAYHSDNSYYHIKNDGDVIAIDYSIGNSNSFVKLPVEVGEKIHEFLKQSSLTANAD